MHTTALTSLEELKAMEQSGARQVILKHNTTCPISKGVLKKLEASENVIPGTTTLYVLELHTYRQLSNDLADKYGIEHQSPQLLVIQNGTCQYTEWGYDISAEAAIEALADA